MNDKTKGKAAAFIAVLCIGTLLVGIVGPVLNPEWDIIAKFRELTGWQVAGGGNGGNNGGGDNGGGSEKVVGTVTTDTSAYDSLDISTSRTVGTNVNVHWYARRSGQWQLLGTGDAADIDIQDADNEKVYAVVSIPSGQSYYIDYAKIRSMNSRVKSVQYIDITGDNVEEYVFEYDLSGIRLASSTAKYVMPSFNVYIFTYDSSFAFGTAPSDMNSTGTTTVTKTVEWYTTISAEKYAYAISKVELILNSSDVSKMKLSKLNIPGIGYLDGSSFIQDVQTSQIKWSYTVSQTLYQALYLQRPVNDRNKFEFTCAVECTFGNGEMYSLTLYVYGFSTTESLVSDSDAVVLRA